MALYSVLIPVRDAVRPLAGQLDRLTEVCVPAEDEFEVIVIDDGSQPPNAAGLVQLVAFYPGVRLLRLARSCGGSVAISAGIAASQGEALLAIEAGDRYDPQQIEPLIAALARADFVQGKRTRAGRDAWRHRIASIPRRLLLGGEATDPDCLFWAARREALAGLPCERGAIRFAAAHAASLGFRVDELAVETHGAGSPVDDARANPGDLLAHWWRGRRIRTVDVEEVSPAAESLPETIAYPITTPVGAQRPIRNVG
jgi:dolichol-phosphate mannosyltransferase